MSLERIGLLIDRFRRELRPQVVRAEPTEKPWLEAGLALELLESMLLARHLDRAAHELRASGHGHYTICSSGHEANVVLGRLTTKDDPSLVHYRSAAFQLERARQVPEIDGVADIALSLVASRDEPASGGRHKVFGNRRLGIIPQTSTIASHLPRAVGIAFALERRPRLESVPASPAVVLASFGDASINHSTAQGALNAAGWVAHQNLKLPILFVCEDNGLGISVRTPPGWVAERIRNLPHLRRFFARGVDLDQTYAAASAALEYCRAARLPAILHLECVRLLGHAGSDVDTAYRSAEELALAIDRDPVFRFAVALVRSKRASAEQLLELESQTAARVDRACEAARSSPRLEHRAEVLTPLIGSLAAWAEAARPLQSPVSAASQTSPKATLTLAQGIQRALGEILEQNRLAIVFGEDVAKKGGVYGVTKGLFERFGALRVFNTLLDEQTILGLALGAGTQGLLPIAEIQYLAYLHNAEDQLRGEAATFRFFSAGDYQNPMIVRVAGLGYQRGFGGHFHNDNSLAVLRDIPGLFVAIPARADDALALYRAAAAAAPRTGAVVVMVEPIALYHRRDLVTEGDGLWLAEDSGEIASLGRGRLYLPEGRDLLIVTYGNGVALSLAAAQRLAAVGISARVLDLRWLNPLPVRDVLAHAEAIGRVLVVDECRHSGNLSEGIAAILLDASLKVAFARVTSADCYIPLGEAAQLVLLSETEILHAARQLMSSPRTGRPACGDESSQRN